MTDRDRALDSRATADISWFVDAIRGALRPLVRLCIGRLPYNTFAKVAKELYVDAGREELAKTGQRETKSALSLLTGIDHRTIDHAEREESGTLTSSDLCPEAAVLGLWANDPIFHGEDGKPAKLWKYGNGPTFQRLVTRVAPRNVTAPAVLSRLIEAGNVAVDAEGRVELITTKFVPVTPSEQNMITVGAAAWQRLGRAIDHNISHAPDGPFWLQQDRWSVLVRLDQMPMLREELRAIIHRHIKEVETLMESYEQPVRTSEHGAVGLGWYYWESETETS